MSLLTIILLAILAGIVAIGVEFIIKKLREQKVEQVISLDYEDTLFEEYQELLRIYKERLEGLGVDFVKDPVLPIRTLELLVKGIARSYLMKSKRPAIKFVDYADTYILTNLFIWLITHKIENSDMKEEDLKAVTEYLLNLSKKIVAERSPGKAEILDRIVNDLNDLLGIV